MKNIGENPTTLMDERQAAKVLGLAVQTLRNWRHERRGPDYRKLGRAVRYDLQDLHGYSEKKRIILEDK
jgi:predicted DNA-binding transcriptional regulator AlpA